MTLITDDMKTDWFSSTIDPVRPGVYETSWDHDGLHRRYAGNGIWEVQDAAGRWQESFFGTQGGRIVPCGGEQWRGLKAPYDGETS